MSLATVKPKLRWRRNTLRWGRLPLVRLELDEARRYSMKDIAFKKELVNTSIFLSKNSWDWKINDQGLLPFTNDVQDIVRERYIHIISEPLSHVDFDSCFVARIPQLTWMEDGETGIQYLKFGNLTLATTLETIEKQDDLHSSCNEYYRLDLEFKKMLFDSLDLPAMDDIQRTMLLEKQQLSATHWTLVRLEHAYKRLLNTVEWQ